MNLLQNTPPPYMYMILNPGFNILWRQYIEHPSCFQFPIRIGNRWGVQYTAAIIFWTSSLIAMKIREWFQYIAAIMFWTPSALRIGNIGAWGIKCIMAVIFWAPSPIAMKIREWVQYRSYNILNHRLEIKYIRGHDIFWTPSPIANENQKGVQYFTPMIYWTPSAIKAIKIKGGGG